MKASEIAKQLQEMINENRDCEVEIFDNEERCYNSIDLVEFSNFDKNIYLSFVGDANKIKASFMLETLK